MKAKFLRYHITLGKYRTTISLDRILSNLMALKLGVNPEDPEAHSVVRQKLEELIEPYCSLKRKFSRPTQLVTEQAILYLVDTRLAKKYKQI